MIWCAAVDTQESRACVFDEADGWGLGVFFGSWPRLVGGTATFLEAWWFTFVALRRGLGIRKVGRSHEVFP
jgi:hypothetical protein